MAEERTDVAALFARLKEEIRASGPRATDVTPAQVRLSARDQAERLWAVSAERPIVGKGGPIKALPAPVDALVRRAGVRRPAGVQRRRAEADRRSRRADRPARAEVRIAVCRPQVPFIYGGAEVVADQLADELRVRGHEVELVTIPFAWEGRAPARPGAPLAARRSRAATPKPVELVIGTKFPSYGIRHPNKVVWLVHQFRQAYDFDRGEFGQFSESPADRATAARRRALRPGRARRGEEDLHHLRQRRRPAQALLRPRRDRPAAAAAEARYRTDGLRRLRVVGEPARPLQADRPADRGGEGRPGAPHRDRRRRARPRPARGASPPGSTAGSSSPAASTVTAWPTSTPAASPSTTRPSTRTTGWSLRGVPLRQAGRDDGRRRRAARGRPRRRDRPRRRAGCRPRSPAPAPHLVGHADEARALGEAGKAVAERITWDACIEALLS